MAKHLIVWTALCGLLAGLLLGGASPGAQAQALTGTTGERLWYHEAEFAVTPGLRAQPHQVVILHLAPGTKARKPRRHTIPYLFAEEATFNFCVPTEDPHIRALSWSGRIHIVWWCTCLGERRVRRGRSQRGGISSAWTMMGQASRPPARRRSYTFHASRGTSRKGARSAASPARAIQILTIIPPIRSLLPMASMSTWIFGRSSTATTPPSNSTPQQRQTRAVGGISARIVVAM